ncbi:uncharacterized protein MONBRDRAFT_9730 [Monosiga brevicollis MX1]|uniref:PPM-type phosphatase domain-containing protein n=1 Tax=Monosiga brevicollis TaxID=81824 RepID=A9V421_MONBE|nr:uncharacterized protein MONBRDRAFT_9730 [Monosiga brevicollis MX1]EDQ87626.1 predicted protein [Monosiga brevicollis MX1]|eukprot:XP_001747546.1 hypothetical protein [Monosiga brevicollis MX1]
MHSGPDRIFSFKVTENKWCERAKSANDTAGSCSTAVVVKGSQVYCGNAGDSKALLFQINETHGVNPVELNERHGTNLKSERKRILAAGGKIAPDGSVYGVLFPSRGFGDIDVKADGKPVVICTPNGAGIDDWQPHRLEHSEATWLVVASDGLWDFVVDDQVMSIVAKNQHLDHSAIAKKLIDEARLCGSEDDITIIVVRYDFAIPQNSCGVANSPCA